MTLAKVFKFKEARNTACFVCTHVINQEHPILYVSHDEDASWQFLCGKSNHTDDSARIISLEQVVKIDSTTNELYPMPIGFYAERTKIGGRWELAYLMSYEERALAEAAKPAASITSTVLGKMQQDTRFDDCWDAKPQKIAYFKNQYIAIKYPDFTPNEDLTFIKDADEVVKNILALTKQDRLSASKYVYQNCMDFLESIGDKDNHEEQDKPMWDMKDPDEVWGFVKLSSIDVVRHYSDDGKPCEIYAIFYFECDWEDEHGLQLVFNNQAKLTRVSAQDCSIEGWQGDGMINT